MVFRVCHNCEQHFEMRRPHQRFCSANCRHESWATKRRKGPQRPAQRVRRASRDGWGAHVYLTPPEIDFLENNRVTVRSVADWEANLSIGAKLIRAKRRLRRK